MDYSSLWKPLDYLDLTMHNFVFSIDPPDQLPILIISEASFTSGRQSISNSYCTAMFTRLGLPDVYWFIVVHEDTIPSIENLLRVLCKYDTNELYYIGQYFESSSSTTTWRMVEVEFLSAIGVPITKEPGFHQFDIHGNAFGLLTAHPVAPFVPLHHVGVVEPIFSYLGTLGNLRLLVKAMQTESSSFVQQSIYHQPKHKLCSSISLGCAVHLPELQKAERAFQAWILKQILITIRGLYHPSVISPLHFT